MERMESERPRGPKCPAVPSQAVTQRFVQELEAAWVSSLEPPRGCGDVRVPNAMLLPSAQSAFGGKYFIHWTAEPDSEEFFKFDVVDRDNYNEVSIKDSVVFVAHAIPAP